MARFDDVKAVFWSDGDFGVHLPLTDAVVADTERVLGVPLPGTRPAERALGHLVRPRLHNRSHPRGGLPDVRRTARPWQVLRQFRHSGVRGREHHAAQPLNSRP